ncbi:MAG: hypothetical protein WCS38_10930, partial [Mesotoga sp.]|uniref:hypothetical protein n=1 Tax=Mesotoga sp. TaxID=2053577 RepID=UPI00356B4EDB
PALRPPMFFGALRLLSMGIGPRSRMASECFPLKASSLMLLVSSEDGEPLTLDLRRLPAKQPCVH